ncbi:MAG TPA: hypothetical protein VIM30_18305 [Candidatus Limnocylindrales bacterium]|jgi:hypothetical protein
MSFLQKAREAAEQAAEQARQAADRARVVAGEQPQVAGAALRQTSDTVADPKTAEKVRDALGRARRGIGTAIDRIDPKVLADVVIKATALQEKANASLRDRGSFYRISEIGIGAAIPPSVTFTIARIDAAEEMVTGLAMASTDLVKGVPVDADTVEALDGTMITEAALLEPDQPAS